MLFETQRMHKELCDLALLLCTCICSTRDFRNVFDSLRVNFMSLQTHNGLSSPMQMHAQGNAVYHSDLAFKCVFLVPSGRLLCLYPSRRFASCCINCCLRCEEGQTLCCPLLVCPFFVSSTGVCWSSDRDVVARTSCRNRGTRRLQAAVEFIERWRRRQW